MELGIVLGARCNAQCGHCADGYGPGRSEALPTQTILRLMDEAAAISAREALGFAITGGEPFARFETLVEIVSHGASLGGAVSCVTNGYWATTEALATARLSLLRHSGLTRLAVSVSRFHRQFVPLQRVRRALAAAAAVGIPTTLKGAVLKSDLEPGGALALWQQRLEADEVEIFPVLPYLRPGEALPDNDYYRWPGLPREPCPGELLTVDIDGTVRSCCSPGPPDEFLTVGHVPTPLREIERHLHRSGRQRILRERGPIAFARAAIAAGLGDHLRGAYAGPCDLCVHIRTDPSLRRVAEEMAAALDAET